MIRNEYKPEREACAAGTLYGRGVGEQERPDGEQERPGTEGVEHSKVATGSQKAARQQRKWQRLDDRDLHSRSLGTVVLRTVLTTEQIHK